ncbi:MAG: phasin family protein [Paracoccaceae bacterium]
MAKATRAVSASSKRPAAPSLDPATALDINQRLLAAASQAQTHAFERLMDMGQNYLAFIGHRIERDIQLAADLAAAQTPSDIAPVWSAYFGTARQEYLDAFQTLLGQYAEGVSETAADLQHQIDAAEEVAEQAAPETRAVPV